MCDPATIVAVASAGINYQNQKAQQKAQYNAQVKQNKIAKANAIQRYASEQLKISQEAEKYADKGFDASLKSRRERAKFISLAGDAGIALSGSTNRLMADYWRVQGNYMTSLENNMDINIAQYERNLEAIQFGQEAQSTYVQPPNPELLFASNALNVASTYYSGEAEKTLRGLKTNKDKRNYPNPKPNADA